MTFAFEMDLQQLLEGKHLGFLVIQTDSAVQKTGFDLWVGKIPWRKAWQRTSVFLPGEFHGQRSLASYSPWGRKEKDLTERLTFSLFHNCFTMFFSFCYTTSESTMCIYTSPPSPTSLPALLPSPPSRSSQSTKLSSLCYSANSQ